ncbi:MAG TPA: hypothetical protein P5568_10710 [Acidobacteriota bacterium]|jgi:hypothetical protein|nr:hypothetical protein [Acidobacteriota bacterium]HRR56612.1 hypothetical protein [Acidobacteriota bacterium]HRV08925.1 hypothetical protein [Acidobacteriota bacterium]
MARDLVLTAVVFGICGFLMTGCAPPAEQGGASWEELVDPDIFWADPKVIQVCEGDLGETTLHWDVVGRTTVEVHVDGPEGPLFTRGSSQGSERTGAWVRDGMWFFLTDPATGEVIATCRVRLTRAGCPEGTSGAPETVAGSTP